MHPEKRKCKQLHFVENASSRQSSHIGMYASGVTYALAAIFSTGQRNQLLPFASQMWTDAAQLLNSRTAASSVVARKYATKLVQRIGLTFLPATVAAWRYQQNSVSINESLSNISSAGPAAARSPASGSPAANSAPAGQQAAQKALALKGPGSHAQGESVRAALQPSPLVNTSPVVSPSGKAHALTAAPSERPAHSDATDTVSVPEGGEEEADTQQTPPAGAAEEMEDDVEIPEEIEEVSDTSTQALHPQHCSLFLLLCIVSDFEPMQACVGQKLQC